MLPGCTPSLSPRLNTRVERATLHIFRIRNDLRTKKSRIYQVMSSWTSSQRCVRAQVGHRTVESKVASCGTVNGTLNEHVMLGFVLQFGQLTIFLCCWAIPRHTPSPFTSPPFLGYSCKKIWPDQQLFMAVVAY